MFAGVVPSAQTDDQRRGIGLENPPTALDESGAVELPVVLEMEDVGRVDLRIGAVDRRDLSDARAGADQLGAEFLADRGRIAIAILNDNDPADAIVGVELAEAVERALQQVVALAGGEHDGRVRLSG